MAVDVWNSWMLMALVTAAAWAISCVIDVCFVGARIYRQPSDGPIISGLFCIVPLLVLVTDVQWEIVTVQTSVPAVLAGVCYFLHAYFYFKALFTLNDASNAEIFNTLSVLFVPSIAFLFLGERLAPVYYLALGLALGGVLILVRHQFAGLNKKAVAFLLISVLFISLTMVLQARAFEQLPYWNGVVIFSAATFLTAIAVVGLQWQRRRRVAKLCWRFGGVFLVVQLLELTAILASQRATNVGPSVSLVVLVECALPLFIMALSLGINRVSHHWNAISDDISETLTLQTAGYPAKCVSMMLIGAGIFLVQL